MKNKSGEPGGNEDTPKADRVGGGRRTAGRGGTGEGQGRCETACSLRSHLFLPSGRCSSFSAENDCVEGLMKARCVRLHWKQGCLLVRRGVPGSRGHSGCSDQPDLAGNFSLQEVRQSILPTRLCSNKSEFSGIPGAL